MNESTQNKFDCPRCGSADTRSFQAIAEAGTSSGTGRGSVSDLGGYPKDVNVDFESATDEANLAAKPKRQRSWQFNAGLMFAAPIPLMLFWVNSVQFKNSLAGGLSIWSYSPLAAIGFILLFWGLKEDEKLNADLEERQERWPRMWRCTRCANSFEVGD